MKQNNQLSKPFFAQFLEAQKKDSQETQNTNITKPWLDVNETHKYPSDSDEEWDIS
jgi:Serine endopeptidase inhibitors